MPLSSGIDREGRRHTNTQTCVRPAYGSWSLASPEEDGTPRVHVSVFYHRSCRDWDGDSSPKGTLPVCPLLHSFWELLHTSCAVSPDHMVSLCVPAYWLGAGSEVNTALRWASQGT